MRRFSSPLDSIKVASPCPADWDTMIGDERKRFCTQCSLNVFNLSEMTRDDAEQFMFESEGRICARFYRRADGTIITKDCPVGVRAVRDRVRIGAAVFTSLIATFIAGVFSVKTAEFLIDRLPLGDVPAPPYLQKTVTAVKDEVPMLGEVDNSEMVQGMLFTTGRIAERPLPVKPAKVRRADR